MCREESIPCSGYEKGVGDAEEQQSLTQCRCYPSTWETLPQLDHRLQDRRRCIFEDCQRRRPLCLRKEGQNYYTCVRSLKWLKIIMARHWWFSHSLAIPPCYMQAFTSINRYTGVPINNLSLTKSILFHIFCEIAIFY